jgi:arylsulfatase A-like enzyme
MNHEESKSMKRESSMAGTASRRMFLAGVAGTAFLSLAPRGRAAEKRTPTERKPNIIFALVDDVGYSELGCYGNRFNETPDLDRMAAEGMRFTDAYAAAPVCSPTRASLLSGQYPARVGITDYLRGDDPNHFSPEKHISLAKALREGGYHTGLIGKWHLMGDYKTRRGDPKLHGFEEVICSETSYIGGGFYFYPYKHMAEVKARWENEYLTDRLNLEAVEFIERNKDTPFFLYFSHYAPHTGLKGKPKLVEKYKQKPGAGEKGKHPVLAAMLESIDDGVGMMLAKLKECGIDDNTLFIFMSDNGGEHKVTTNAPLRGAKSQTYEGGIREPLIARWPGSIKGGSVCQAAVSTIDFYPTFLELTGAKSEQFVDGVSIVPLLRQTGDIPERPLFWHYPLEKPHFLGGRSSGAVRLGDFKLIEFYDTGELELYNLKDDLGETKNLAEDAPEKVVELRTLLANWRKEVGAVL